MTKDEMQRFLDLAAQDGDTELEAAQKLFKILGIMFPGKKDEQAKKK